MAWPQAGSLNLASIQGTRCPQPAMRLHGAAVRCLMHNMIGRPHSPEATTVAAGRRLSETRLRSLRVGFSKLCILSLPPIL